MIEDYLLTDNYCFANELVNIIFTRKTKIFVNVIVLKIRYHLTTRALRTLISGIRLV